MTERPLAFAEPSRPEPPRASRAAFVWPRQGEWTYEDWLRLPEDDGWRYEVVRGRLYMSPAPRPIHQRISAEIGFALQLHLKASGAGEMYYAPIDVFLPGEATPVEPDIVVLGRGQQDLVSDRGIEGVPALVVEILSPSTRRTDLEVKRPLYAEAGIPELWIVDPEAGEILIHVLEEGAWRVVGPLGRGEVARSERIEGFAPSIDALLDG